MLDHPKNSLRATRSGKVVEQVRHGAISTVQGDQFVAAVRCLPIALGAGHQNDCA